MDKKSSRSVSAFSEGFTELRACRHCGTHFEPRTRDQDFCPGGKCRRDYHNETYALGKVTRELRESTDFKNKLHYLFNGGRMPTYTCKKCGHKMHGWSLKQGGACEYCDEPIRVEEVEA